jgi:Zn-dependent membrane protease YugP
MFFFDPMYVLLVMLPGILLSGAASMMVKHAFNRYSRVASRRGFSGAQAAQVLLQRAGIQDVEIVATRGFLSDHYNPTNKQLALSEAVYGSNSIAAIGVATHEAGHAIQHATGYAPLWLRSALVPTVGIGSRLGMGMMVVGLLLQGGSGKLGDGLVLLGAILFSAVLLFQIVTLPVEFNASSRAKRLVVESGIVYPEERQGIDAVLNAAALTYVAAAVSTLLTLLYFLIRAGLLGGRRD